MPTKIQTLSNGERAIWHTSNPEGTVVVFKPHPKADKRLINRP